VEQPGAGDWREMLARFPAVRQVFHALTLLGDGEDATELLEFAAGQEWMADLARHAASVARIDGTVPLEPGHDDDLVMTLEQLYAASRVRDLLLLAHQPAPVGDAVGELDDALGREQPQFEPVPVGQMTAFFAAIGCRPLTQPGFDPILHEIVTCEADDDPQAPIQVTGYAWPSLMIGELVFTRGGVHVRAGAEHAVPGVADRSVLHWEYWRRHRTTSDGSFCWGHNSQWKTELRRDYLTDHGRVYDFDALSEHSRRWRRSEIGDSAEQPLTADQAEFIKNRCRLRGLDDREPDFPYLDCGIDERHR
jgi:hypothetical protein